MALEDIDSLNEEINENQAGHINDHKKIVKGLKSIKQDLDGRLSEKKLNETTTKSIIGERRLAGRSVTMDNSAANSFHLALEVPTDTVGIQLIMVNTASRFSDTVLIAKACTLPASADLNGSSRTWTSITKGGQASWQTQVSTQTYRPTYTYSDMIPVHTIPRTDGGTRPLIAVRAWVSGNATLPALGNGTDDFTNWASRSDGLLWVMRHQAGNAVTDPTLFTSTVNRSQSPIVGIRFVAKGRVTSIAWAGDSIYEGRGTFIGEGFVLPAIQALSSSENPLVGSNHGWSGQPMSYIVDRVLDLVESANRPNVLIIPGASPNDQPTTLTSSGMDQQKTYLLRILAACKSNSVIPIVCTMLPVNSSVNPWGASDSLRVDYNQFLIGLRSQGILVADTATPFSGTTTGGQVQITPGFTSDNIHPNDAGNAALTAVLSPELAKAVSHV